MNDIALGNNEEVVSLDTDGIEFNNPKIDTEKLFEQLNEQYAKIPQTTCAHNQVCCKAGNPHLTYVEYLNVIHMIERDYSAEQKTDIALECIKRYISRDLSKPCLFLGSKGCTIYNHRQFNCRMYGMVPQEEYEERAKNVMEQFKARGQDFPLAKQCSFVEIADGSVMTLARYNKIVDDIVDLDKKAGISRKAINEGKSYFTFHDWWMMSHYGEDGMVHFTEIRLNWNDEQKAQLLSDIEENLRGIGSEETSTN
jgi:Fe-S-cluster containining protein